MWTPPFAKVVLLRSTTHGLFSDLSLLLSLSQTGSSRSRGAVLGIGSFATPPGPRETLPQDYGQCKVCCCPPDEPAMTVVPVLRNLYLAPLRMPRMSMQHAGVAGTARGIGWRQQISNHESQRGVSCAWLLAPWPPGLPGSRRCAACCSAAACLLPCCLLRSPLVPLIHSSTSSTPSSPPELSNATGPHPSRHGVRVWRHKLR